MNTAYVILGTITVITLVYHGLKLAIRGIHDWIERVDKRGNERAVSLYHMQRLTADPVVMTLPPARTMEEIAADIPAEKNEPKKNMTLDEWLAFNERDWLRQARHELVDEIAETHRLWREKLYAIKETAPERTVEWSREWEEQLNEMLERNGVKA